MTRLALVMIARDEAGAIGRALESAGPTRRPHDRARLGLDRRHPRDRPARRGAQVHEFAWCDDFAAARNAALSHSDADWNLILDADEWLDRGTDGLGPQVLPPGGGGFLGAIRVRSLIDDQPGAASQAWIARVLPRGVSYAGKIHEQPVSEFPVRGASPLEIGHDGYSAENLSAKARATKPC